MGKIIGKKGITKEKCYSHSNPLEVMRYLNMWEKLKSLWLIPVFIIYGFFLIFLIESGILDFLAVPFTILWIGYGVFVLFIVIGEGLK